MRNNVQSNLKNNRGSSLLECVISLALFAVITTMAAAMLGTASKITSRTTDTENAVNAAGDAAELFSGTSGEEITLNFVAEGGGSISIEAQLAEIEETVKEATVSIWKIVPMPKEEPPIPPPVGP